MSIYFHTSSSRIPRGDISDAKMTLRRVLFEMIGSLRNDVHDHNSHMRQLSCFFSVAAKHDVPKLDAA